MPDISELPRLDIPRMLREYGLRPRKSLGQNFLVDESAVQKIVRAAGISRDDTVLEIGPGLGSLTRYLCQQALRVVAVELDANLMPLLKQIMAPFNNVTLLQGDILTFDPSDLIQTENENKPGYLVVANIPYNITSALIRHLLEARVKPVRMILTVQLEVAMRIMAAPGDMNLLALSVLVFGTASMITKIPAGCFFPTPKVDSASVQIELLPSPAIPSQLQPFFFQLARAGFSQKRKTLRNALAAGLHLEPIEVEAILQAADINPKRRAETLRLEEWIQLMDEFTRRAKSQVTNTKGGFDR